MEEQHNTTPGNDRAFTLHQQHYGLRNTVFSQVQHVGMAQVVERAKSHRLSCNRYVKCILA